ncbi:MAG: diacylglycerol kinase family protein [Gemmatimonas sp.]
MNSHIQIIANSGAKVMADAESRQNFEDRLHSVLPGARLDFIDKGHDVASLIKAALMRGATVVAAAGGDGTVNAVASEIVGTSAILGVLPLGTLNHFAKDVAIPAEMDDALHVLTNGRVDTVDVGTVGKRIFLNNSGLGLYPDMVHNRERRQKTGMSKWPAMLIEGARAFGKYRLLHLQIDVDGAAVQRRTPAVFIGNNDYSLEGTLASKRSALNGGQLCLYIPRTRTRAGLVWFSMRAFFGSPTPGDDFDKFMATEFTITSRHQHLRVSIDGEVAELNTPLEYRIKPAALRVMVPVARRDASPNDSSGPT